MFRVFAPPEAAFVAVASVFATGTLMAGCSGAPAPAADGSISVTATDSSCQLSKSEAAAGNLAFTVSNKGSKVTEFYLYGAGDRVIGEVENIGPGLTRKLLVEVPNGGAYTTACKPGMVGDGIRGPFTVTGQVPRSVDTSAKLTEATAGYKDYVSGQVEALVSATERFVNSVKAGNADQAKAQYPVARTYYERIEPVAESFQDLDAKVDGREDDQRQPGEQFTGYHRLEKDLWVSGLTPESAVIADQLLADVKDLWNRVRTLDLKPVELANGAEELLEEVATKKITGEEDRYSHTDLWDFKANVDGSQAAVAALRPVLDDRDKALGTTLDQRFAAMNQLLENYRAGDGFKFYTELKPEDTKKMTGTVDALAEPLSKVAGTVTAA
ncbi:MAG: peptidase M75 family protein [Pseudonocardia sp.]|nr:peptidase M75 family protein [Pseudonocardia sp.]